MKQKPKKNAEKCTPHKINPENLGLHIISTFKPEYCRELLDHMAKGGLLTSFCAEKNIPYRTVQQWLKDYQIFKTVYELGSLKSFHVWLEDNNKWEIPYYNQIMRHAFRFNQLNTHSLKKMTSEQLDTWRDEQMSEGNLTLEQHETINRIINTKTALEINKLEQRMQAVENILNAENKHKST